MMWKEIACLEEGFENHHTCIDLHGGSIVWTLFNSLIVLAGVFIWPCSQAERMLVFFSSHCKRAIAFPLHCSHVSTLKEKLGDMRPKMINYWVIAIVQAQMCCLQLLFRGVKCHSYEIRGLHYFDSGTFLSNLHILTEVDTKWWICVCCLVDLSI